MCAAAMWSAIFGRKFRTKIAHLQVQSAHRTFFVFALTCDSLSDLKRGVLLSSGGWEKYRKINKRGRGGGRLFGT